MEKKETQASRKNWMLDPRFEASMVSVGPEISKTIWPPDAWERIEIIGHGGTHTNLPFRT